MQCYAGNFTAQNVRNARRFFSLPTQERHEALVGRERSKPLIVDPERFFRRGAPQAVCKWSAAQGPASISASGHTAHLVPE
jgi:hypothetical protein